MGFWDFLKKVFGGEPGPTPPGPGAPGAAPGPSPASAPAATTDGKKGRGFGAPSLLSLSPDEWRKRALAIKPWATPWIGRVDTIPPQSDERTALIDRGLILRGKLTPKERAEIHEAGTVTEGFFEPGTLVDGDEYRYAVGTDGPVRARSVQFVLNGPMDAACYVPVYAYYVQ